MEMKVPAVGDPEAEVILSVWHKQDGDLVGSEEKIAEIESDKAIHDLKAEAQGILRIAAREGETLGVGALLCKIEVMNGAASTDFTSKRQKPKPPPKPESKPAPPPKPRSKPKPPQPKRKPKQQNPKPRPRQKAPDPHADIPVEGYGEVLQVFDVPNVGKVAGCRILSGKAMQRDTTRVRIVRRGKRILNGAQIESIRHGRRTIKTAKAGAECGIRIQNVEDIRIGDEMIFYTGSPAPRPSKKQLKQESEEEREMMDLEMLDSIRQLNLKPGWYEVDTNWKVYTLARPEDCQHKTRRLLEVMLDEEGQSWLNLDPPGGIKRPLDRFWLALISVLVSYFTWMKLVRSGVDEEFLVGAIAIGFAAIQFFRPIRFRTWGLMALLGLGGYMAGVWQRGGGLLVLDWLAIDLFPYLGAVITGLLVGTFLFHISQKIRKY